MKKLLSSFTGYRTYLCALGVGIVSVLLYLNMIDKGLAEILFGLLGAGGLAALRAAKK